MNMWNWLQDCYNEGTLDLQELEEAMENDDVAATLWKDFSYTSFNFIDFVREEIKPFLKHVKEIK